MKPKMTRTTKSNLKRTCEFPFMTVGVKVELYFGPFCGVNFAIDLENTFPNLIPSKYVPYMGNSDILTLSGARLEIDINSTWIHHTSLKRYFM